MAFKRISPTPIVEGGTGAQTLTSHGVLLGNGTSAISATAEPSNGQILIGKTGFPPVLAGITPGPGIAVTSGAGTITIGALGGGVSWTIETANLNFTANKGIFANKGGLLTVTLPASGTLGDVLEIANMNTAIGWRIAQNANQHIRYGALLTTVGVGGYLEATKLGDTVKLVCNIAGTSTGWMVTAWTGNLTIV